MSYLLQPSPNSFPDQRKELSKRFIHSKFLPCPRPFQGSPGFQPPESGDHYNANIPMLLQFHPEILVRVLIHLEPIWLFQLERTCNQLSSLLRDRIANWIWYNALPCPLLTTPEHFQSESELLQRTRTWNRNDFNITANTSR